MTISFVLTINMFLYLLMTYRYGKISKISLTYTLSLYYFIIAILGIFIIETGIYENVFFIKSNKSFSILPYFLCFYCLAVLICPLRRISFENISFNEIPYNKTTSFFINVWIVDMCFYLLLKLFQAISASNLGYDEMYRMSAVDGEASKMLYGGNWLLFKFNNFNVNLSHSFSPFVMCYSFYGLITNKLRVKRAFMIIGLIFFSQMFAALAYGSRGNLFFTFWGVAFYYIIFYKKLNNRLKRKTNIIFISLFALILSYSIIISFARLGDSSSETPINSIIRYFGEAFPNLGNLFWNEVRLHPYGSRLFPYLFGLTYSAESVQDGYAFWQTFTGVPVLNFKTIYGDLYIEFGTYLPLIIITVISLLFYFFIGKRKIAFWKMALIYWYFDLVLQGVFGFNKDGQSNLIVFIAILIVSFIIKVYTTNKNKI